MGPPTYLALNISVSFPRDGLKVTFLFLIPSDMEKSPVLSQTLITLDCLSLQSTPEVKLCPLHPQLAIKPDDVAMIKSDTRPG